MGETSAEDQFAEIAIHNQQDALLGSRDRQYVLVSKTRREFARNG